MSQQVDVGYKTFTLAGTVAQYERVKMSGTSIVQAGLTELGIGIAQQGGVSGDEITVALWTKAGTFKMLAAAAVTGGAMVNTAAAGRCDDATTATSIKLGWALEAATAAADVIEVLPLAALGSTANP